MTFRAPRRMAALLAAPALLATGVAVAAPGADAATTDPTYKGSSLALSVKVGLAGSSILDEVLPELVTYPPGSKKTLIELPPELAELVGLKVLNASSEVSNGVLTSNAHTAGLSVLGEVITAKVLNADCSANQGDVTGDSQVAGLTLAGSKVPVDPGPNLKIELPDALAALVKGSIVIDEQTETDEGLRIRALHINLVVAPTAIDDALNSVIKSVRETAEQLKAVVEEVTGQSLDELVGRAAPAKAKKSTGAKAADQDEVRASVAAKKAQQAPAAPAEAAAPAAPAEAAAPAAETEKTDGADLDAEATSDQETAADQQAGTEAAIAAESAEAEQARTAEQDAAEAAAAERAERAEKGSKAEQDAAAAEVAAPASTDPTVATEAAPAAPAPAPAAQPKADGSDLPVVDKTVKALPSADDIAGALGVDIIVSQVTCEGAPGVASVDQLPGTGGNGHAARNIAVTGLGLLAAGGAALVLTRRRRSFGSIA